MIFREIVNQYEKYVTVCEACCTWEESARHLVVHGQTAECVWCVGPCKDRKSSLVHTGSFRTLGAHTVKRLRHMARLCEAR